MLRPLALGLLACLLSTPAWAQRSTLHLRCDGCFGMNVTLDDARLLVANGLAASKVDGHLDFGREAKLEGLLPGPHHIHVEVLQGPLDRVVYYDGPIYLRPALDVSMRVLFGRLVDDAEAPLHEPERPVANAATPTPKRPSPDRDGGTAVRLAALVVRTEDAVPCEVALDGETLLWFREQRLMRAHGLRPGQHRLEVRSPSGEVLARGTLFLVEGEETIAGVYCLTGKLIAYSDARAYVPQPAGSR